MWPVTDRFRRYIQTSHERTIRVEVLEDPTAGPIDITEFFVDGQIELGRNEIRRSGTLSFEDDGSGLITPTTPEHLLAPYGNELRVWSGFAYPDGTEELVPVGTLRIVKTVTRYPRTTVTLQDRAVNVQRYKYEATKVIAAGLLWDQVVADILLDRYPDAEFDFNLHTDATTPRLVIDMATDPWTWLQDTALETLDCQLFPDQMGVFQLRPEETVGGDLPPVWTYDGKPEADLPLVEDEWGNLALYDQELDWDTDQMFNAVVYTAANPANNDTPFYGIAKDTDPLSPTRYGGKYGFHIDFQDSDRLTSNQQCANAAKARLQQIAGIPESLALPAIPNPALDVNDALRVIRPELAVDTIHLLDGAPMPLRSAGGAQRITTRVRRVVPEP
jgi:hypothetical protein